MRNIKIRVLALDAYHGGSHRAFLDGWTRCSRHAFTALTLPPHKWKWRMRHAAVTFADQLRKEPYTVAEWDVLFCTDMLNLAEFRGLCPLPVRRLPAVVYFHENQLTYPDPQRSERDLHFAFTNLTTALAADQVWFNTAYHRDAFLDAMGHWLRQMPDHVPAGAVERICRKAAVFPPGVNCPATVEPRPDGPLHILWVARWEHDKSPETLFAALDLLRQKGCDFRISVLGQNFRRIPECFRDAKQRLAEHVVQWGYVSQRSEYWRVLQAADVVVSTAVHEFFGIAVIEAVTAGCRPLVPHQLAYPEVLGDDLRWYHDGNPQGIARSLIELAERKRSGRWEATEPLASDLADRFSWGKLAESMDDRLAQLVR